MFKNSDSWGIPVLAQIPFGLIKVSGLACENRQQFCRVAPAPTTTPFRQTGRPSRPRITMTQLPFLYVGKGEGLEARPAATINPVLPFEGRRTWRDFHSQPKHPDQLCTCCWRVSVLFSVLRAGNSPARKLWIRVAEAGVSWRSTPRSDFTPSHSV